MTRAPLLLLLCCAALQGCKDPAPHPHPEATQAEAPPERPDLSVTVYQDGLELFMEYPAFVVGLDSPLIAHFTDARSQRGFKAVTAGRVVATLRFADGAEEAFRADTLLRDGIFKPVVKPTRAGAATLQLRLEGPQISGTVDAGEVTVYQDEKTAIASAPPEEPGEPSVPFLKEQQWKTEYATAEAIPRVLQGGVRANGELKPVPGQFAELSSPVQGRVAATGAVPHLGQQVKKGQLLAQVIPTQAGSGDDLASLELEATRARAELGLAKRELARAEELLAARAIPEKQLDSARVTAQVAEARVASTERRLEQLRAAQSGGGTGGGGRAAFDLRSPIDGVISFAELTPGAVVEPGRTLLSVVNPSRLWLEAKVYEADAPKVEQAPGAAFTVAGFDREFAVDERTGRRVAVGSVVDRATRTVPVIFELPNPGGLLKPGMFAKVTVYTGQTVRALAVPESAIVDDGGKPTVFVMEGGESFFKRVLQPGIRSGGYVEVLKGVKEGERVVSRGAYELKLSTAMGAIPEHGHAH